MSSLILSLFSLFPASECITVFPSLVTIWYQSDCHLDILMCPANYQPLFLQNKGAEISCSDNNRWCFVGWKLISSSSSDICKLDQQLKYFKYQFHLWLNWNILHIKEGILLPNYTCLTSIHTNINLLIQILIVQTSQGSREKCCFCWQIIIKLLLQLLDLSFISSFIIIPTNTNRKHGTFLTRFHSKNCQWCLLLNCLTISGHFFGSCEHVFLLCMNYSSCQNI